MSTHNFVVDFAVQAKGQLSVIRRHLRGADHRLVWSDLAEERLFIASA